MIEGRSLLELLERRATATPDAVMLVDERGRRVTFREYRDAAYRIAAGLHEQYGVGPGTRVSWQLPTWIEAFLLVPALARLGAIQNPILHIYREREVRFIAGEAQAELLILPPVWGGFDFPAMGRAIAAAQPGLRVLVCERSLPEGDSARLPAAPAPPASPEEAPVRWIFYSSGTTADPKGARHTDATLMAAALANVGVSEIGPDDCSPVVFPFTHIGGIVGVFGALLTGVKSLVVEKFDLSVLLPLYEKEGVTLGGAGTPFHMAYLDAVRRNPEARRAFAKVRAYPGGGAPKPPQLHYDVKKELGGVGVVSGYGLTECPILAMNTVHCPDDKLANTEGRPTQGVTVKIVTLEGRVAAPGEEGEIRVKGPMLCKGYVREELDREAFDEQGFFRTGDLGRQDAEGYLAITGRLKDIIIRNGENISAKEVEDHLYAHPKVADVAVIGLPDPRTGERCCAVVAARDPSDPLGFDDMIAFLKGRDIARQKIPEQLEIVAAIPRNPSGKILKHELRKRYAG